MPQIKRSYNIGDKFKLTSSALDNYGDEYTDKVYTIEGWADHHCKASEIATDKHGHLGFDESAGTAIYSSELPFDLYEWEMKKV